MNVELKAIEDAVAELPLESQEQVGVCYNAIKDLIERAGPAGAIAVALVGAELSGE